MLKQEELRELKNGVYGLATEGAELAKYTSFRIGGPCSLLLEPTSQKELVRAIRYLRSAQIPFYLIGKGSNLLVTDQPLDCVIIRLGEKDADLSFEGNLLTCEAGTSLKKAALASFQAGLTGMEELSGIPGSVGGACIMNAGAYGRTISDILQSVTVLDREGQIRQLGHDELDLGYRTSRMMREGMIVLSSVFELQPGDPQTIQARYLDFKQRREDKQPLDKASAGSTFKRPEGGYASQLIDQAGLRGFAVGQAKVSDKHCGFLINEGGASFDEVLELIHQVQARVFENSGIQLEPEVRILDQHTPLL
jgi:UDP-N-acetylmuramate dehydrogenase